MNKTKHNKKREKSSSTAPKCVEFIQALAITTSTVRVFFLVQNCWIFNDSELLCFGFRFVFLCYASIHRTQTILTKTTDTCLFRIFPPCFISAWSECAMFTFLAAHQTHRWTFHPLSLTPRRRISLFYRIIRKKSSNLESNRKKSWEKKSRFSQKSKENG